MSSIKFLAGDRVYVHKGAVIGLSRHEGSGVVLDLDNYEEEDGSFQIRMDGGPDLWCYPSRATLLPPAEIEVEAENWRAAQDAAMGRLGVAPIDWEDGDTEDHGAIYVDDVEEIAQDPPKSELEELRAEVEKQAGTIVRLIGEKEKEAHAWAIECERLRGLLGVYRSRGNLL